MAVVGRHPRRRRASVTVSHTGGAGSPATHVRSRRRFDCIGRDRDTTYRQRVPRRHGLWWSPPGHHRRVNSDGTCLMGSARCADRFGTTGQYVAEESAVVLDEVHVVFADPPVLADGPDGAYRFTSAAAQTGTGFMMDNIRYPSEIPPLPPGVAYRTRSPSHDHL